MERTGSQYCEQDAEAGVKASEAYGEVVGIVKRHQVKARGERMV